MDQTPKRSTCKKGKFESLDFGSEEKINFSKPPKKSRFEYNKSKSIAYGCTHLWQNSLCHDGIHSSWRCMSKASENNICTSTSRENYWAHWNIYNRFNRAWKDSETCLPKCRDKLTRSEKWPKFTRTDVAKSRMDLEAIKNKGIKAF